MQTLPRDTKWVIVWDTDRFGRSELGQILLKEWMARELDRKEDMITRELGLQLPWRTINRIVLFGRDYLAQEPHRGLALVWMDFDLASAITNAIQKQIKPLIRLVKSAPCPVYVVNTNVYLAVPHAGLAVMGASPLLLEYELNVLYGHYQSLSLNDPLGKLLMRASEAIICGAALGLSEIPVPVASKLNSIYFSVTEQGGRALFTTVVECEGMETAGQLYDTIIGGRSLALLMDSSPSWLQELCRSLNIIREGSTIQLQAGMPTNVLKDMIKALRSNRKLRE